MSNHYHIVLKLDPQRAERWDDDEVLKRWTRLFSGPQVVQRFLHPQTRDTLLAVELEQVRQWAAIYRQRLCDLSWYMRVLNEGIAREANREDGARGRFWEGRFKSQALLDEQALLMAMSYVDLNPIRAGIVETPEASDYTSIQARLLPDAVDARIAQHIDAMSQAALQAHTAEAPADEDEVRTAERTSDKEDAQAALPPAPLMPFDATGQEDWAIPYAFEDYVELVETLGRCLHPHKRGSIPEHTPRILERLGVDSEAFIAHGTRFLQEFGMAVGKPAALVDLAARRQARFLRGMGMAKSVFANTAA